jgi:hypothetical protein
MQRIRRQIAADQRLVWFQMCACRAPDVRRGILIFQPVIITVLLQLFAGASQRDLITGFFRGDLFNIAFVRRLFQLDI